jgi:hypothetical protein
MDAFGYVIVGVVVVSTIIAIVMAAGTGELYDQIGKGGLSLNDGSDRPAYEPALSGAAATRERDDEIRQMLVARNARREARGQAPMDVEAEFAELTKPVIDPGLRGEIRELVIARNHRRVRQGKEPLDVEAEVLRQIEQLNP